VADKLKRVTGRQLVRILERMGWHVDRVRGSHHIMRSPVYPRVTLSVPVHGRRALPIGTLSGILRDAAIGDEEFNQLV
jgi:predicted RNA binding protein YcfA (HicA-like mRNA interferase family)